MNPSHPKRITPPAPVGSMLKQNGHAPETHRASGAVKHEGERSADYLEQIRQLPCLYCGVQPAGEAAHVKFACASFGKANMMGKRVSDARTVPLCRDDHQNAKHAQHRQNEEAFWISLGIQPYRVTDALWAKRGDLVAMENVVRVAIAERSKK